MRLPFLQNRMGRYYWGDIKGKFWFGIQDSNDAINFKAADNDFKYVWVGACGCEFPDNKEARKHVKADCPNELFEDFWDPKNRGGRQPDFPLAKDEIDVSHIAFCFHRTELPYVLECLEEIWNEWSDAQKEYYGKMIAYEDEVEELRRQDKVLLKLEAEFATYQKEWFLRNNVLPPDFQKFEKLMARLYLGKQIVTFFEENPDIDTCNFECECS